MKKSKTLLNLQAVAKENKASSPPLDLNMRPCVAATEIEEESDFDTMRPPVRCNTPPHFEARDEVDGGYDIEDQINIENKHEPQIIMPRMFENNTSHPMDLIRIHLMAATYRQYLAARHANPRLPPICFFNQAPHQKHLVSDHHQTGLTSNTNTK